MRFRVFKRIANTDHWGFTGDEAEEYAEALSRASQIDGGAQTGVKIVDTHADYDDPAREVLVAGC